MKMIKFLIAVLTLMSIHMESFAQIDIKMLDGKGADYIIDILGSPDKTDDECGIWISYANASFLIDEDSNLLFRAYLADDKFRILSDYIQGGVRVGDSFKKLQSVDFSQTRYGRKKAGNALKPIPDYHGYNYIVFAEEANYILFSVSNGVIKKILYETMPDWPYPDYDPTITIW